MGEGAAVGMPDDDSIVKQVEALKDATDDIDNLLDLMIEGKAYDRLNLEDKVKHDLFVSYAITSLYWMYMRTIGENPTTHVVKGEIDRIQEYVKKYHRVKDRKKRPTIEKGAAKRFVKSGLWDPQSAPQQPNKKIKFDDDDDDDDD